MELNGIFVPNVTPFDRYGEIDTDALLDLVEFWMRAGVSGLVVNASTGEAPLLNSDERLYLINLVIEKIERRGKIIAGTGSIGTKETINLTKDALDAGVDAALVASPYFFRPSEEEIYRHFCSLLTKVDLPVILYNVPKFTGYSVPPKVVDRIADECSNLVGIKDSSGNPGNMAENIRLFGEKINILSGAADMTLPTLSMGGKGAILAVANAIPKTCVQLYREGIENDLKKAGKLQLTVSYINKILVREHSQIASVKIALNFLGYPAGVPRSPMRPLPAEEEKEVIDAFSLADIT